MNYNGLNLLYILHDEAFSAKSRERWAEDIPWICEEDFTEALELRAELQLQLTDEGYEQLMRMLRACACDDHLPDLAPGDLIVVVAPPWAQVLPQPPPAAKLLAGMRQRCGNQRTVKAGGSWGKCIL